MLQGGRLRRIPPAARLGRLQDSPLEAIVPNPSGGRGVYVLPWTDIGALCRPTMHDTMLVRRLSTPIEGIERDLTPGRVRDAARAIALQGLAGQQAASAAEASIKRRDEGLLATRFTLLMVVTEQMEARRLMEPARLEQEPLEIEQRGGLVLVRLARELGQPPQRMSGLLDQLALQFLDVGCGLGMANASLPSLVSNLGVLRNELSVWAQSEQASGTDDNDPVVRAASRTAVAVAGAAEITAQMARVALDAARARLGDMPGLLRAILADTSEIARCCDQASWLLDGWEQIWLTWHASPGALSHHDAVRAIGRQIPALPDEAEGWLGLPAGTAEQLFRRPPPERAAFRDTGSHFETIARNEHFRALAD